MISQVGKEPIAIVGMGCRFPGAGNLLAFWKLLCEGQDAITPLPSARFDLPSFYDPRPATPGKTVAHSGGILPDIDLFDHTFFGISEREAPYLDPQARLLLEITWEALEDAGEVPERLAKSQTGVFIGATYNEYEAMQRQHPDQLTLYSLIDSARYMASGRLSHVFDLRGPSLTLDTACSSSLVAVHLACQSIWNGESEQTLAGGVNLMLQLEMHVCLSQGKILASDQRCKSFDAQADGYVRSEGAGIIFLKPLSQALTDSNPIYALIRGTAVSNDGQSTKLIVTPSLAGQTLAMRKAYQDAGISPTMVTYVEAHATGTKVGDPVEVSALSEILGESNSPRDICWLGSVKTNLGHMESAAGIAGLIKAALCLKHRMLVPNLHYHTPNPLISWSTTPFQVVDRLMSWPVPSHKQVFAGVNAFGISGTNAHIVLEGAELEEAAPSPHPLEDERSYLLALSAKSDTALLALAQSWQQFLSQNRHSLIDLCYTAYVRRSHHTHRLAVVGSTCRELAERLEAFCQGTTTNGWLCGDLSSPSVAQIAPPSLELASLQQKRNERIALLKTLSQLYTAGVPFVWEHFFPAGGRCVSLPCYTWQRTRAWFKTEPFEDTHTPSGKAHMHQAAPLTHPLLQQSLHPTTQTRTHHWEIALHPHLFPYFKDHRLGERMIFPAAASLELIHATAQEAFLGKTLRIEQLRFERALFLAEDQPQQLKISVLIRNEETATVQLSTVPTPANGAESEEQLYASGVVRLQHSHKQKETSSRPHFDLAAIGQRCLEALSKEEHYHAMEQRGLSYGPTFRGVEQIWRGDDEALARIQVNQQIEREMTGYLLHPALLDACFQVAAALFPQNEDDLRSTYLPIGLDMFSFFDRLENEFWVYVQTQPMEQKECKDVIYDISLLDDTGQVVVQAKALRLRRAETAKNQPSQCDINKWFFQLDWEQVPSGAENQSQTGYEGHCLIFAEEGGVGESLKAHLETCGQQCIMVSHGDYYHARASDHYELPATSPEGFQQLLLDLEHAHHSVRSIVHLWSLDTSFSDPLTAEKLQRAQERICGSVLHLVQALAHREGKQPPRLFLVTRNAQAIEAANEPLSIAQSPLWGLGRVIFYEHPELRCTLIDLDPQQSSQEIGDLANELRSQKWEEQIAFRAHRRHLARLLPFNPLPAELQQEEEPHQNGEAGYAFRLESAMPGLLEHLHLVECASTAPEADEVEIQVYAAGVNFRNVLTALDINIGQSPESCQKGFEFAGYIRRVGSNISSFQVGDAVITLYPTNLGSSVTVPAKFVVHKPEDLRFEEAATLLTAFATAYYALCHLGRLAAGERILIHCASGGVGLAAVQLAQWVGAEIFATAGSPEKRDYLRSLGIAYVMDSRSLDFVDEVLATTNGEGVDVVLNSLSGDALIRSIELLRLNGRFLEIGKRDIYQDSQIGLHLFRKGLSFSAIALDQLMLSRSPLLPTILKEILHLLRESAITLLPFTAFPMSEYESAYRYMSKARHIGKVVLTIQNQNVSPKPPSLFNAQGTYLLTGGLGGLGLTIADWMVTHGARHLVLLGRRKPSRQAEATIEMLKHQGAEIVVQQADITRYEHVASVLDYIKQTMPPLRGIMHAAMVVDDGTLQQLDQQRFYAVLAPKLLGAWHLHQQTHQLPLDFFICFSSVVALLGSPGQGNYCAANAFLDMLAHERRRQGLPALTISWGVWAKVGKAAALAIRGERIARRGLLSLTPEQGLQALGLLLTQRQSHVAFFPLEVGQWLQFYPHTRQAALFARLKRESGSSPFSEPENEEEQTNIREHIMALTSDQRLSAVEDYLKKCMIKIAGEDLRPIEAHISLPQLGVDSLMGIELRNAIAQDLGLSLPTTLFLQQITFQQIVEHICKQLPSNEAAHAADEKEQALSRIS